ncbi:MAG: sarcosine oxidase subunit gamma [Pseudomonadota bacterium]
MVERISALAGAAVARQVGTVGQAGPGVRLSERRIGRLWQIAAWPERLGAVGAFGATLVGVSEAPGPGRSLAGPGGRLIRTEPLKWLVERAEGADAPALAIEDGSVLDLSHARTLIRVEGSAAPEVMARLVSADLRPQSFGEGAVALSSAHGVGITVLRRGTGYDLLVFRSFALSLWEQLAEIGAQFGCALAEG